MEKLGSICVFFKSPVAGSVKTRLIPAAGAEGAAQLARAFFLDTWASARLLPWARPIVAIAGPKPDGMELAADQVWPQGDGDLGERLERGLRRALSDSPFVIALGADSPGLPVRLLEQARAALDFSDAVLGPCEDGGFYLIGLRRCPPGLLAGIPWSQPETYAHTLSRLQSAGLKVHVLEPWFDVDRPEDLATLRRMVADGDVAAPETARRLQELSQSDADNRGSTRPHRLKLSVIIPALNELEQLPQTLARIEELGLGSEIIVVDGGSTDGTGEWLVRQSNIRVVESARGKGVQLNAGARVSSGDVLLFLHADCRLPPDAGRKIEAALKSPEVIGGGFLVRFAEQHPWLLRPVAAGINLRSRLRRSATGDQAIFVRRSAYQALGGFSEWPLFEDVDFVKRLKKLGRFAVVNSRVTISARRYLTLGILRTVLTIHALRAGYWAGISPFILKKWFEDLRPHLISGPQPSLPQDRVSPEALGNGLG